jgi:NAD(P)-dependent dehydrogenase (short-subunit alcohol dehydrogenase family)
MKTKARGDIAINTTISLQGTIVACCRSPDSATALKELISAVDEPNRIQIVSLDVEDQDSIESASLIIKDKYGRVDMLLNVAGILGDGGKTTPGPERSLSKMDRDWLEKTMAVNLIGPVMLSKELAPLMMQRRNKRKAPEVEERAVAVIANLSARVGSIADNGLGGWYSYRMSKAALNQATRTMALELKRQATWCVALHPGTTNTDLSKPFQANVKADKLFPVEFTVGHLLDIIDSMEEDNSGGFYDWAGQALSF